MIVRLLTEYELHSGNIRMAGERLDVHPELGRKLLAKGIAVQLYDDPPPAPVETDGPPSKDVRVRKVKNKKI